MAKTRCKDCFYSPLSAVEEPCNKCSEIQMPHQNYENQFSAKSTIELVER